MPKITNFDEANAALSQFVPNARKVGSYSLGRMQTLMAYLGNPQDSLKAIHVAGTSGKTSTSYYAAALLQAAGHSVGLTVSPHVVEVNDRVQINGIPLPEAEFCRELTEFLELIETSQLQPTYFESLVAFAYWEFSRRKVDYAVVEVGLGGLLDGTNVITRADKVCVITDIGLDHVNILGRTLPEIAAQKAGIIQPGNKVFCYQQEKIITDVFKEKAEAQQAELRILESGREKPAPDFLPLFQRRNYSLAEAAVDYVLQRDHKSKLIHDQRLAAAHTLIPARMEVFHYNNKTIILDGAHNAQKLKVLSQSIKAQFPGQDVATLVSFVDGRSYRMESSLQELSNLTQALIVTTFQNVQDMPHGAVAPDAIVQLAKRAGFVTIESMADPKQALQKLLSRPEPILLVTGSFFLMNDIRPLVQSL